MAHSQVPAAQLTSAFTMDEPALRRHLYAAYTRQCLQHAARHVARNPLNAAYAECGAACSTTAAAVAAAAA
jgi:hypothetical protein